MNPENTQNETKGTPKGKLADLLLLGQSLWLDSISRHLMDSGELDRLIGSTGIRGITSNPTIFEKAINGSTDYDTDIARLASTGAGPTDIIRELMVSDVRRACDFFRPVYDQSRADDGYVSIEVNPLLAHETKASIEEGKRLHTMVGRPNLFVKIPATPEGIPAIRALIADGISVNVTLIFSPDLYRKAAHAYLEGIREWVGKGGDPAPVRSVASLFVSRLDTLVDRRLEQILSQTKDPALAKQAESLPGKAGIANAQVIYESFREIFHNRGFSELKRSGVRLQRPLWASTGTKNPKYSDVLYVDNLIAPDTVNTVPAETLAAFVDHGTVYTTLERYQSDLSRPKPHDILDRLERLGISLSDSYNQLISEGVTAFNRSYESLLESMKKKAGAQSVP